MTTQSQKSDLDAQWKSARLLYPLYVSLAREFVIDLLPSDDLTAESSPPTQDAAARAAQWLLEMDERIQVYQLRQFLQTTTLSDEEALQTLLRHHLTKPVHSDADRDKIDFLLVQLFSQSAPSRLDDADVDLEFVATILHPILGPATLTIPEWLKPLEALVTKARAAATLKDLLTSRVLEDGRKLKVAAGEKYYFPSAMVAFTRFSFLMRRVFFRLMHQDLNAILDGLRELERAGLTSLDCRRAQFSADEPVARLRIICQSWKVMFHAEYSSGQPLGMLVDLRGVVDAAKAKGVKPLPKPVAKPVAEAVSVPSRAKPSPPVAATKASAPPPKAVAHAAGAAAKMPAKPAENIMDFEVSAGPTEWEPNQ